MISVHQQEIAQVTLKLKDLGFRVFVAESGTYGFYTDEKGTRMVSFQSDAGGLHFSGNYISTSCGTGWRLGETTPSTHEVGMQMLYTNPPKWATRGERVSLTSVDYHLAVYQPSSKYREL